MSLCLTRAELAELTRTKLKAGQAAFLRSNGIRHSVAARGWPVVRMRDITALLDEVDRRFGIGGELIAARPGMTC